MKYFFLFGALLVQLGIKAQTLDPANFPGAKDVDKVPVAPGCDSLAADDSGLPCFSTYLVKFLGANFTYPAQSGSEEMRKVLHVGFVIGTDGTVSDVQFVKSMSDQYDVETYPRETREAARALDAEVIRVISLLQFDKPAYSRGKAVPMYFTMPLKL